jgi:hypothetical protein
VEGGRKSSLEGGNCILESETLPDSSLVGEPAASTSTLEGGREGFLEDKPTSFVESERASGTQTSYGFCLFWGFCLGCFFILVGWGVR